MRNDAIDDGDGDGAVRVVCVSSIIIIRKAKSVDNLRGIVIQSGQPLLIKHCPSE